MRRRPATGSGEIHIGTSGWTYADWSGRFYPEGVEGAERLAFYARHFDTVEVNSTFYRLPFRGMITAWNRRLGPSFHLVLKGPRVVTHLKKLIDCREPLARFLERVLALERLRVILWQLPPSLPKDVERLERFLVDLPREVRHAVEFRHPSWWGEQVAALLARLGVAFVGVSHPRLPAALFPTTDILYYRFHGLGRRLYDYDYSLQELEATAGALGPHLPGRVLYAFFNNDMYGNAVANARTFRSLLTWPDPRR